MPYVIAEPCVGKKDRACESVCPVDCIHGDEDSNQLFINGDECICCGACVNECPVEAIFWDSELPKEWAHYAEINAAYYRGKEE